MAYKLDSTPSKIWLVSVYGNTARNVAWINSQANGDISVGLSDAQATIEVSTFADEGGQTKIDHRDTHPPEALIDPHFTYHHPAQFHLVANKSRVKKYQKRMLLRGLVWTTHLADQECSPWLRVISNPLNSLKPYSPGHKRPWLVPVNSEDCSIGLWMDFVNALGEPNDGTARYIITNKNVILRARAACLPAQRASMNYLIVG
jgi:hypothetical protein